MPDTFECPECGEEFKGACDDDSCPQCLVPLQCVHKRRTIDLCASPCLTGPQMAIDAMMRHNRGVKL